MRSQLIAILIVAVSTTTCTAIRTARLYDLQSAEILTASYKTNGSGKGPISLTAPTHAACSGEYVTVPGGDTSWGAIYGQRGVSQAIATSTSNEQHGRAVLTCPDGLLIECEYIASAATGAGAGQCRDNRQRQYRLMF